MEIDPETQGDEHSNIRDYYTVTDKADGDREMMFISSKGYIYLLDTNMNVQFTLLLQGSGASIDVSIFNTIKMVHILIYMAFDIYYITESISDSCILQSEDERG